MTGNLSASILARLLTLAKQRGDDYNLLLNRFGMERLLARVSMSPHADRFLLRAPCSLHSGMTRHTGQQRTPTCSASALTTRRV
jgi:hypothetical protein